jgi:hypothetical protein
MFYEKVQLPGGVLEIELRDDMTYLLRYGNLIEYSNGRRRVRGRTLPYEFRSVEQLRYDFAQDLAEVA